MFFSYTHTHKQLLQYSHDGLNDPWVSTHAQVVVAAPNGHLLLFLQGASEVVGHGELVGQTVHGLEHAVGVVTLLLVYLLLKKLVVLVAGHCNTTGRQSLLNEACIVTDEATPDMMKVSAHLTQNVNGNMRVK